MLALKWEELKKGGSGHYWVDETVMRARERFKMLGNEYLLSWCRSASPRTEDFAAILGQIEKTVLHEIADFWDGNGLLESYKTVCQQKVEKELLRFVEYYESQARKFEIERHSSFDLGVSFQVVHLDSEANAEAKRVSPAESGEPSPGLATNSEEPIKSKSSNSEPKNNPGTTDYDLNELVQREEPRAKRGLDLLRSLKATGADQKTCHSRLKGDGFTEQDIQDLERSKKSITAAERFVVRHMNGSITFRRVQNAISLVSRSKKITG